MQNSPIKNLLLYNDGNLFCECSWMVDYWDSKSTPWSTQLQGLTLHWWLGPSWCQPLTSMCTVRQPVLIEHYCAFWSIELLSRSEGLRLLLHTCVRKAQLYFSSTIARICPLGPELFLAWLSHPCPIHLQPKGHREGRSYQGRVSPLNQVDDSALWLSRPHWSRIRPSNRECFWLYFLACYFKNIFHIFIDQGSIH